MRDVIIKNPNPCGLVYEDEYLIAVNKPAAMHSVVHDDDDCVCVSDCLLAYDKSLEKASRDPRESGLVHRLDFFTTGIIVAARERKTWEVMRESFSSSGSNKTYLALTHSVRMDNDILERGEGCIRWPIALTKNAKTVKVLQSIDLALKPTRDRVSKRRVFPAQSDVIVLGRRRCESGVYCLVEVRGDAMRRHQVRAHLASIGAPLVGDELYGSSVTLPMALDYLIGRAYERQGFLLHAHSVGFPHPEDDRPMELRASSGIFADLGEIMNEPR